MKKNDILQSMMTEAQDISIPELSDELNSYPITVIPIEIRATKKKRKSPLPALLMTLILVMGLGIFYSVYIKEETLLTIDLNPSIELKINAYDRIIGVKAYNDEGQEFLDGLNINNCTLDEALKKVITKAYEEKYITDEDIHSVLFSVKSLRECKESSYQSMLKSFTQKYKDIETHWVEPSSAEELEARNFKVSPAKFAFFKKLYEKKYGKSLPPPQVIASMVDCSVTELVDQYA